MTTIDRINELPKCPYCGENMRLDADSAHVWMKCDKCLSCGPKVYRPDFKNSEFPFASWSEFWDKCRELAIEAARTPKEDAHEGT